MRYHRYQHTAVVSYEISDIIDDLQNRNYLTPDVRRAATVAPLVFPPVSDLLFQYGNQNDLGSWYNLNNEQRHKLAHVVLTKFNTWYTRATPVERAYLALTALTETTTQIDTVVDNIIMLLHRNYRIGLVDSDDSPIEIGDYHAIRDRANIMAVCSSEPVHTFIQRLQEQVDRIVAAPVVDLNLLQLWETALHQRQEEIISYYYKDIYRRSGVPQKTARKALHRSYQLLDRVYGKADAQALVQRKEIRISANLFVWGLKLTTSLIEYTIDPSNYHTPFIITLYDHTGNKLCHGCVLWPKTPVLDQAIAFKLATANPDDEREMLTDTNFAQFTQVGIDNEILKPYRSVHARADTPYVEPHDRQLIAEPTEPYVAEVEPWVNAVRIPGVCCDEDAADYNILMRDGETTPEAYRRMIRHRHDRRDWRYHNDLVRLVQNSLLDQITGPADIIEYLAAPETRSVWFDMAEAIANTRLASYLTTKHL